MNKPSSIGGDKAGIVDEGEEGCLEELDDDERSTDPHQRNTRETNRP